MRTTPLSGIAPMEHPSGWQGEAVSGWSGFSFAALPWPRLRKRGDSMEGIECVKVSASRKVLRIPCGTPGQGERERGNATPVSAVFAKRYLVNNLRRRWGNLLRGSKAEREFRLGHALLRAGIPTPVPLAYAAHRSAAPDPNREGKRLPAASYLLTLEWPNAGSVRDWLRAHTDHAAQMGAELGQFLAWAHGRGFYHDDCSAEHILVADDSIPSARRRGDHEGFAFIDIDNGRLFDSPVPTRERMVNLFQILRSLSGSVFPAKARQVFLSDYLSASGPRLKLSQDGCEQAINRIAIRKVGKRII